MMNGRLGDSMKLHGEITAFIKKRNIKKLALYGIVFMMTLAAAYV